MNKGTAAAAITRLVAVGLITAQGSKGSVTVYHIRTKNELLNCALIPDSSKGEVSESRAQNCLKRGHKSISIEVTPPGVDNRIHVTRNLRVGTSKSARVSADASTRSPSFSFSSESKARERSTVRIPSLDEVINHGLLIGLTRDDCEAFFDHHAARGWRYKGNLPMRDYKAALSTWKRNAARFARADDDTQNLVSWQALPSSSAASLRQESR